MNRILLLFLAVALSGCKGKILDLADIDFNQPAKTYLKRLDISRVDVQKGHWEVNVKGNDDVELQLKDGGEQSAHYVLMDQSDKTQVRFFSYNLDPVSPAKIVEYKNKVAFYNCYLETGKTFEILNKLKEKLGQPTELVMDTIPLENNNIAEVLLKGLPKTDATVVNDDLGDRNLAYPRVYVWKKGAVLYQYTLDRRINDVGNVMVAISLDAFKDRIIVGYHALGKDPILGKYLK